MSGSHERDIFIFNSLSPCEEHSLLDIFLDGMSVVSAQSQTPGYEAMNDCTLYCCCLIKINFARLQGGFVRTPSNPPLATGLPFVTDVDHEEQELTVHNLQHTE